MTASPLPDPTPALEREAAAHVGGLFERHGRMVYGVCRAMLRDVHEAEDATQQAFLSAHRALLGGAHVRDAGAWLATIARNECRGRIAARMRTPLPVAEEDLFALPSPVDEQARHEQALEFREALAELPERQREAVVLRYLYGLRYGEVATALGLSRPATEALLFRARRGLRGTLRPVVGAVLVVPLALREELALAIPGFSAGTGVSTAAVGIASGGVLGKLVAGPVGVKVATTAVAVSTVGAVGTIESDRPVRGEGAVPPIVATTSSRLPGDDDGSSGSGGGGSGHEGTSGDETVDDERSDPGRGRSSEAADEDRSGPSSESGRSHASDDSSGNPPSDEHSGSSGAGESGDPSGDGDSSGSGSDELSSGSDSSGSGSGSSGSESDSSGSGSSGSGSSGSGSSGSGSSGSGSEDPSADADP
ncbi:MAG: RNA polymerase sigma factor [Gaiellaceae bacterium]